MSDAWTAISAVGRSRISPTTMTSGSCRISERSPVARSKPAARFTCDCETPGTEPSIGSSRVARLRRPPVDSASSRRQARHPRTRITDDPAIDTEPAWSPDGANLYFTSDRSGGPQIYRTDVAAHQRVQRITFGSAYNARPRPSPDGRSLALVSREGSDYRIGVQDLASGNVRVLTRGSLDESPSFAPNGMSLIYASRVGGAGTLATVAVDGQVSQRLKSDRGDVREPVWGPFASP